MTNWTAYNHALRRTTRLIKLAAHQRTSVAVLVRMAMFPDQHEGVLATLLCNPNLPLFIAEVIARERLASLTHGWVIRQGVAASPLVSANLHRQVAERNEWYVAIQQVNNPQCPRDVLLRWASFHSENEEEMKKWKDVIDIAKSRLNNRPD